jgi:hypothetical protein
MIRFVKHSLLLAAMSITCWAQTAVTITDFEKVAVGVPLKNQPPAAASTTAPNGIQYYGGPVMNAGGGTNVYTIWYGDWSNNTEPAIVTNFINHIGGTAYFNMNTSYYDYNPGGQKDPVVNRVNNAGSVTDNYSLGTDLSNNNVAAVVGEALSSGTLPVDPNGVYFVLTSKDVLQQQFCVNACAWHGYGLAGDIPIKVAFVGNSNQCPFHCQWQNPSPNNNPAADDATNMIAHELSETVTDPLLNAWVNPDGTENGDLCQWTFGKTMLLPNGSSYNVIFGQHPYLIQRIWVNARGGYCALALDQ